MFHQIHIVACSPRTGTTLLHEAMVTCFKVDKHYQHEMRFHKSDANAGEVLVTKRPKDTYYMSKVLADTPGLHVIYLLRDPRDAIVSRHAKDKTKFYSNIPLWRELHGYGKALRRFDNCLEIKYEDFVTRPDDIQDQIHKQFPWLEKRYAFSEYHEHAAVSEGSLKALNSIRAINPSSIGLWKQNLGRIKAQQTLHGSLSAELIECGYENSTDWETMLNDVDIDRTPSYYPEKITWLSRLSLKMHGAQKVAAFRRLRKLS